MGNHGNVVDDIVLTLVIDAQHKVEDTLEVATVPFFLAHRMLHQDSYRFYSRRDGVNAALDMLWYLEQ